MIVLLIHIADSTTYAVGLWHLLDRSSTPTRNRELSYGYASDYKKSVHAKCFLNSWYFRGYGPG